ncbi:MAG: single-stranded-DNA-specific exonuclease RecJ [Calditrichaeota bacterium]|nr:single-stranded-DNA-specific exonuclease RecJ [Calditrichota bacterium]MCB9367768.1 single-stranded-DNA-specific exonuclease RecJ [Calditrichota bacterium]
MQPRWEMVESRPHEEIERLSRQAQVPYTIARILLNRGMETPDAVERFFSPSPAQLYDPFLMSGMEKAVDRIVEALQNRDRIAIYGDYDVDGITSVSMLYLFLRDLGGDVVAYIPDRQNEGYGISQAGLDEVKKQGAQLVISVDCGITSVSEAEYAKSLGLELIISDHHEPADELPAALAVLDPKCADSGYPFSELAGVGVTFKLAQGITKTLGLDAEFAFKYIDLVALGTSADIVPLIDENRVLVKEGLEKLNAAPEVGLASLIESAGVRGGKIDVGQIVFNIAPRINAVGRMGSAMRAVQLLTTRDQVQAREVAQVLEQENRRRKEIDNETLSQALEEIRYTMNPNDRHSIVLSREGWHSGVIGIVASRLIEKFYRPTVMISVENGMGKGSARSVSNFDIFNALKACSELLEQFGGHKYAAGLTIPAENIPAFKERFEEACKELMTEEDLVRKVKIESEIELDEITPEVVKTLKRFEPFGPHNTRPTFVSRDLGTVYPPRIVGQNHLKLVASQNGTQFEAIGFNLGDHIDKFMNGRRSYEMVYVIEENEYQNRKTTQLRIKDIR